MQRVSLGCLVLVAGCAPPPAVVDVVQAPESNKMVLPMCWDVPAVNLLNECTPPVVTDLGGGKYQLTVPVPYRSYIHLSRPNALKIADRFCTKSKSAHKAVAEGYDESDRETVRGSEQTTTITFVCE
jgi:hypothetical protein